MCPRIPPWHPWWYAAVATLLTMGLHQLRRIAAYGVMTDVDDRVLLVRSSDLSDTPGVWYLPGGGVEQGEHPADAVVREVAEETGLVAAVSGLLDVVTDVTELPGLGVALHNDRVIYAVARRGGTVRDEVAGTTDLVRWVPRAEIASLSLMPFVARQFGLPAVPPTVRADVPAGAPPLVPESVDRPSAQRFAAHGVVTDPAGRVLLSRIAAGYPDAGRWHLPGGGTDHGETPTVGLARELAEETAQQGRVTALLDVSSRHLPAALGPEGYPMDWHTVRALYRVVVDAPTDATVAEGAGGSTADARWVDPAELPDLPLTGYARDSLARYLG